MLVCSDYCMMSMASNGGGPTKRYDRRENWSRGLQLRMLSSLICVCVTARFCLGSHQTKKKTKHSSTVKQQLENGDEITTSWLVADCHFGNLAFLPQHADGHPHDQYLQQQLQFHFQFKAPLVSLFCGQQALQSGQSSARHFQSTRRDCCCLRDQKIDPLL